MTGRLKRALWCRWFHRWRWYRSEHPQTVVNTDPATGQSLTMTSGPHRSRWCSACEDRDLGRAMKQWLAS